MAGLKTSHDRLGSLIVEKTGSVAAPRVALDAHLDEIGFMVETVRDDGMLSFLPLREQFMIRAMLVGFEAQALVTRPRSLSTFSRLPPRSGRGIRRATVVTSPGCG